MAPMYRSAIPGDAPGGNTSAVVRQLSGARQACATLLWVGRMADLIMDSTGVIDWVVAVEETTTLSGVTPCAAAAADRKSTRLNSSHVAISYAVFCLKKKQKK